MEHARKSKFSSYVHLPSTDIMFQFRYARLILCSVEEVIIFKHGRYISALEYTWMLILSSYVLLACLNTTYKYGQAWVI